MPVETTVMSISAIKNISYVAMFIAGAEYLGFNAEALSILGVLMLIDIFTGIIRAATVEGMRSIRSAVLKKGVIAKLLLLSGLLSVGIAAKGFGLELEHFAQGIVSVLILGELYSILGNIHSVRTGEPKHEFDAVVWMLNKVKLLLDKVIRA